MSAGRPLVVVTTPGVDPAAPWGRILTDAGLEVRLVPRLGPRAPGEMVDVLREASAAILSTDPVDRETLRALPRLRVLARSGVGYDGIDVAAAAERGIPVVTSPGRNEAAVADHAVALMLAVLRRVAEHDAAVRAGRWDRAGPWLGWELTGRTVGLVGYGAIGRLVGRRLAGFEVRLLVHDVVAVPDVEQVGLPELLRRSDVVSLHVPLLPSTRGLIGARELALLGPDGVLVNTSRGEVVDEAALAVALAAGRLRGAALDVFATEPPVGSPLLDLPTCVLTPHVAGLSVDALAGMLELAARSVVALLAGEEPPGRVVDPAASAAGPAGA